MSFDWSACAERQQVGHPTRKQVLLALASRADQTGYCWPSYADIVERTELSKATVKRAIDDLEVDGFVTRTPRYKRLKSGEFVQDTNGYQLHLDWELMARPPALDRNHGEMGGGVTVTRGVGSPRPRGGVTVTPEPVMEPVRGTRSTTRRRGAASGEDRRPVRRTRGEDHGDDESPALGASPAAKTTAERDEVAATRGTSGKGLGLRLKRALAKRTDELGNVDPVVVGKHLNDRARRGQSRELQAKMVEVFAAAPERYARGDVKGTWAFINALAKLEADASKHLEAEQGGSRYGGAYDGITE